MDFNELSKNIELIGRTVKAKLDEQKKGIRDSNLPMEEKASLLNTIKETEKSIASGNISSLINTLQNFK